MRIFYLAVLFFTPCSAFAYFDPGTGSILIQGLVGAIAMVSLYFRSIKMWFLTTFQPKQPKKDDAIEQSADQANCIDQDDR